MDETTIRGDLVKLRNAVTEVWSMMQYDLRRRQTITDIREQAERLERVPGLQQIAELAWSCADYNLSWTEDDYTDLLRRIARRILTADEEMEISQQEDDEKEDEAE